MGTAATELGSLYSGQMLESRERKKKPGAITVLAVSWGSDLIVSGPEIFVIGWIIIYPQNWLPSAKKLSVWRLTTIDIQSPSTHFQTRASFAFLLSSSASSSPESAVVLWEILKNHFMWKLLQTDSKITRIIKKSPIAFIQIFVLLTFCQICVLCVYIHTYIFIYSTYIHKYI